MGGGGGAARTVNRRDRLSGRLQPSTPCASGSAARPSCRVQGARPQRDDTEEINRRRHRGNQPRGGGPVPPPPPRLAAPPSMGQPGAAAAAAAAARRRLNRRPRRPGRRMPAYVQLRSRARRRGGLCARARASPWQARARRFETGAPSLKAADEPGPRRRSLAASFWGGRSEKCGRGALCPEHAATRTRACGRTGSAWRGDRSPPPGRATDRTSMDIVHHVLNYGRFDGQLRPLSDLLTQ